MQKYLWKTWVVKNAELQQKLQEINDLGWEVTTVKVSKDPLPIKQNRLTWKVFIVARKVKDSEQGSETITT